MRPLWVLTVPSLMDRCVLISWLDSPVAIGGSCGLPLVGHPPFLSARVADVR